MENEHISQEDIDDLFGGEAGPIKPNEGEVAVALALSEIRQLLSAAAQDNDVGVNQLASRLNVSPSSVSRFFSAESDLKVSTAVLYALALGRSWKFDLCSNPACADGSNFLSRVEFAAPEIGPLGAEVIFMNFPDLAPSFSKTVKTTTYGLVDADD